MIDRKIAPSAQQIKNVNLIQAQKSSLKNDLPLYSIVAGTQELVKIEWLFDAGSKYESQRLSAQAAAHLLKEGTVNFTSAQIAESLDYYGAFLETECNKDIAHITLYSLNKHVHNVLPILEDILKNAVFPQHEVNVYKQNSKQKLLVNNQKVDVLARNHFNEIIFGKTHPYGVITEATQYDELELQNIKNFYAKFYRSNNCKIVVSGFVTEEIKNALNKHFGESDWSGEANPAVSMVAASDNQQQAHLIERPDAVQSAIRIGRLLFNKTHPDYFGMQVLNTILGGYFGSRLMNNIREDKGYTYGIGSAIASLQNGGYFFISTEVGVDVCSAAVSEIYAELKNLRDNPVSIEELELVRSYLMGTFLRSIDGPFALSEKFNSILPYNLGYDFYERYLNTVRTITPVQIQELAKTYLRQEDMVELIVGKK
jgi:zinc protease